MKMKRIVISLCSAIGISLGCIASTPAWGDLGNGFYRNPIIAADFSDPDVIRVGDKYYMVASDFHFMGMQMLESDDMVNWSYASKVYDSLPFASYDTNDRYASGSWAPALRYHDGFFYVYFCTPHEGLFMSKSDSPYGPWSPLLLVKEVEKWEDPCPFWDTDGSAYLGHSLYGAGPIIIHKMSADGTRLLDEGVTVYEGPVAEGTKIHKFGDMYFLSIPEGGVKGGWQTVLRSHSLYGPYERRIVLEQGSTQVNGPHQGAIVDAPDGSWWFYHFQETDALGRVLHLQPMRWTADDWPAIGLDLDGNGVGEPVDVFRCPVPGKPLRTLAVSDDFCSPELGLQWQWNHNPVDSAWSLSSEYGSFTLDALKADSFKKAKNTLTQKAIGFSGSFTTALDVSDMAEGQRAGLACMGKGNEMVGVMMSGGERYVYAASDSSEQIVAKVPADRKPVCLRLDFDFEGKVYAFSYSFDGKDFFPASAHFYLRWGHWKGVRPALFSYNTERDGGKAHFHFADYRHDGNFSLPTSSPALDREAEARIVSGIALTSFPDRVIAVNPGAADSRCALQAAVDSCSLAGGGIVDVLPGVYNIRGNIVLKSNVNLHLRQGAVLLFSGVADDFLPPVFSRWEGTELYGHSPMIYALHAVNVAITGKGEINGQAGVEMAAWAEKEARDRDRLRAQGEDLAPVGERVYGGGTILRPSCIEFVGCSRILVEDVTVKNSPFWTIHPVYCDNVVVRGVVIDSAYPNNDGCDPESTSNVLIENCRFNVGDDAIAIKAGRDADGRRVGRPSENIVIRHCLFNSLCNGLCIGSEMSGGVANVYMHDIQIENVKNAIYFKSNRDRGGYIRNVFVSDITVEHTLGAVLRFETNYFGFRGGRHASQYENFHISNVHAERSDHYALFISGYPEKPVRGVTVENLTVASAPSPCYLHCTDGVSLINVYVNGELLPSSIPDDPEELILPVY